MTVSGSRCACSCKPAGRVVFWHAALFSKPLAFAALWSALALVQAASGEQPAEELKTKEKVCTDTAAAWFKENWPDGKASTHDSESTATYLSHYHTKRGKCLILGVVNKVSYSSWQGKLRTLTKQLIDLEANRAYATFVETNGSVALCVIEGRACKTEAQWDTLVRALYFEDETAAAEALKAK